MKSRTLTVFAQDPSVASGGKILRSRLSIPWEDLQPGPKGSRFHVIDFDASTGITYKPLKDRLDDDPYDGKDDDELLGDPGFHAANTYAICMSTLAAFEQALGRRVSWEFRGPQLKIAPHAFAEANAYYSRPVEGLLFGYIPKPQGAVFSCLSHDIIVHETTHAILDGLRPNLMRHSMPDQAGFHEGFADIIALLSVLSQEEIIRFSLDKGSGTKGIMLDADDIGVDKLKNGILFGLAEEFGRELNPIRGDALRRSIHLEPGGEWEDSREYVTEPHYRGEVLSAAVMSAFLRVWYKRFSSYLEGRPKVSRTHVVAEGAAAAVKLRDIVIRALNYTPPIHLSYSDLLVGLLTADKELYPDDIHNYRSALIEEFGKFGIRANAHEAPRDSIGEDGCWIREEEGYSYEHVRAENVTYEKTEAFRFLWDNRERLGLLPEAYTEVVSVQPMIRYRPDGFVVRETIIEYLQLLNVRAREAQKVAGISIQSADKDAMYRFHGGGLVILDEYVRVKYHICNRLSDWKRQQQYADYLNWIESGEKIRGETEESLKIFQMHLNKALG